MGIDAEHGRVVARGWRDRRLIDRLGIDQPILLAPMAGAGGPALAIAAMRGGALGSLPPAMLTPERLIEEAGQVRAAAEGPLNLNFFCHRATDPPDERAWRDALAPYYAEYGVGPPATPPPLRRPFSDAMCEAVEAVRPEVVSFHFGLPEERLLRRTADTGAFIIASATSPAERGTSRRAASMPSSRRGMKRGATPGASCRPIPLPIWERSRWCRRSWMPSTCR